MVALGSTTDTELPNVVQVAGLRLVRGPDGVYVGMVRPDSPDDLVDAPRHE
jgi:hypothetical protein